MLPALLPLLAFTVGPMVAAVVLSGSRWDLGGFGGWVGASNYTALWEDHAFRQTLTVTAKLTIGIALPVSLLALTAALLLSGLRRSGVYQAILFLPAVIPSVVSALVWAVLFQSGGLVNTLLGADVGWLTDPRWAPLAIILVMIWTNVGYYSVILLAGVRDIPEATLEAARVDGCGYLRMVWHVMLPQLRPVLLFVGVVATNEALSLFAQPFLLTAGGPNGASRPLAELIYDTAFQFADFGRAAALSVILLIVAGVLAVVQFRFLRREDLS